MLIELAGKKFYLYAKLFTITTTTTNILNNRNVLNYAGSSLVSANLRKEVTTKNKQHKIVGQHTVSLGSVVPKIFISCAQ